MPEIMSSVKNIVHPSGERSKTRQSLAGGVYFVPVFPGGCTPLSFDLDDETSL